MASSGKNMDFDLDRKRKTDLEKEYKKAKYKIEKLEGELKQAKQEVNEMKKDNEILKNENDALKKRMEAAVENSKKQIQDTETDVGEPIPSPSGLPIASADPRLVELKIFLSGLKSHSHTKLIPHDQPFETQMVFDFTGVLPANYLPAECHFSVYAKSITTPLRQRLTESKFPISDDKSPVNFGAKALQKGHYRLEIELALYKLGQDKIPLLSPPPSFLLKGGRIHVY